MSLTVRYFIFPDDSSPLRLSQRLVNGLTHGDDAMPQYANSRQKIVGVILNNQDGKPIDIHSSYGAIWTFDEAGEITESLREAIIDIMESIHDVATPSATVVSIQPRLNKKRVEEKYRWSPTRADIERITKDIWSIAKGDRLKDARGVSRRRPPLTFDAKKAIEKASSEFWKIANEIEDLKALSLKGFLYEARHRSIDDPDYRHLYEALGKMGADQLELLKRRGSGKGVWYAVIEVWRSLGDHSSDIVKVFHRRCEDRPRAVIAARELLAEHAGLFDVGVTLEASILTDIEWKSHSHSE